MKCCLNAIRELQIIIIINFGSLQPATVLYTIINVNLKWWSEGWGFGPGWFFPAGVNIVGAVYSDG